MANPELLEVIQQGAERFNQWRKVYSSVPLNLSGFDLSHYDLIGYDLNDVNLSESNLSHANLSEADLRDADLRDAQLYRADLSNAKLYGAKLLRADLINADLAGADLNEADLSAAKLREANLRKADVSAAKLHKADLRGAKLRGADFSGADFFRANLYGVDLNHLDLSNTDLSEADLRQAQVVGTTLTGAVLTGACIENLHITNATRLDDVVCDYVYLKGDRQERRPRRESDVIKFGEFSMLFQEALDTVDLIFQDGIDWQAFFQSFQDLRNQYAHDDLSVQGIQRKRGEAFNGEAFVIGIEVSPGADKTAIENSARVLYEMQLELIEQRYRAELQAKEGEIVAYREQSANLMKITELLASSTSMTPNNTQNFYGATGNVANTNAGRQQNIQHNYAAETLSLAEAAAEIQTLLNQLEVSNPSATEAERLDYLNIMIPPTRRQRFMGALKSASSAAIDEIPYGSVVKALVHGWQQPNG